jgi:hypothetical protein
MGEKMDRSHSAKLIIVSQFIFAMNLLAQPSSSNFLNEIGAGTELHVLKDIHVPGRVSEVTFLDGQAGSGAFRNKVNEGDGYCRLWVPSSVKNRVMKAGLVIRVEGIYSRANRSTMKILSPASLAGSADLGCYTKGGKSENSDSDPNQTIGAFERHTHGYFKIVYPEPEEIK